VLDLVATGFNKPEGLFGHTMREKDDVIAAADAFKQKYTQVRTSCRMSSTLAGLYVMWMRCS
jgi:hypothetical protein